MFSVGFGFLVLVTAIQVMFFFMFDGIFTGGLLFAYCFFLGTLRSNRVPGVRLNLLLVLVAFFHLVTG